jgi:hypothetical protein
MCFIWISKETVIISLRNINWLVCVTEKESAHCAVRAPAVRIFTSFLELVKVLVELMFVSVAVCTIYDPQTCHYRYIYLQVFSSVAPGKSDISDSSFPDSYSVVPITKTFSLSVYLLNNQWISGLTLLEIRSHFVYADGIPGTGTGMVDCGCGSTISWKR